MTTTTSAGRLFDAGACNDATFAESASDAAAILADAQAALWSRPGEKMKARLTALGLTEATIRDAGLGFVRDGGVEAVTVPWRERGRLSRLVVDRLVGKRRTRHVAWRDRPTVYLPTEAAPDRSRPLVVCDSEYDAMAIGQGIGDHVAVIAIDGRDVLSPATVKAGSRYPAVYAAHRRDDGASQWPGSLRVKPRAGSWIAMLADRPASIRDAWADVLPGLAPTADLPPPFDLSTLPPDAWEEDDAYAAIEREAIQAECMRKTPPARENY